MTNSNSNSLENPRKLFPLILTEDLDATRRFYVDKLGWTATHDLDAYLQVRLHEDPESPELAFMLPGPQGPCDEARVAFAGRGVMVSVPVADADAHHGEVRAAGLEPTSAPSVKPWGWRSYALVDPNGVVLDFFHVAEAPAAQTG